MIERYGADRVARLEIYNLPGDVSAFIQKRVSAIAGSAAMSSRGSGKTMSITCAPVADIQDLAANIDFGTVTDVDLEQSVITVRADPSKLPAPLAPEITNPRDPDFYKQNLADLNCIDRGRIERAMERLAQVERKELRQEIADALKGHLLNKQPNIRRRAVKAYALWVTEDIVPQMVDCLNDDEASVRQEALEALARLNDTRSYEPIAALLVTDNLQAGKYLKQIGSPAQKAVAEYFTHAEERVRHDALSLAKEIGTNEIVPELIEVLSQQDDRARHLAADILGKLRDERAVAPLCEMLLNDRVRGLAAGSLRKMGPMVEEVVLKGLKHPNPDVVKACCEILAEVGTEKSLPELSRLARSANFFVRASAMHAGRAVTSRRQPAPKGDIRAFGRSSPD